MANVITSIHSLDEALQLASKSSFLRKCDYIMEVELPSSVFLTASDKQALKSGITLDTSVDEYNRYTRFFDANKIYLFIYDLKIPALGITYSTGNGLGCSEIRVASSSNLSIGYYSTYETRDLSFLASQHNEGDINRFVPWSQRPDINIYLGSTLMYRFEHCLFNIPRPEVDPRSSDIAPNAMEISFEYYKVLSPERFTPRG